MKKWYILALLGVFVTIILSASSCDDTSTPATESQKVDSQNGTYATNQPLHTYDYSPERDELQQIYDARMKVVNTWTVIYSMGKAVFSCPSKGYPIPYTTQLTNPQSVANSGANYGYAILPQAEPNGLYTGQTTATWVLCIRNGEILPVYSETDALAFPYPVQIDGNGNVQDAGGASSAQINVKEK